jgi:hypothetical protein
MNPKNSLTLRWRTPRALALFGLMALVAVVAALAFTQTSTVAAPPPPLTGEFNFIELPQATHESLLPMDVTITPTVALSETFDHFSPKDNPTFDSPGWQVFVQSGADKQKWDRVQISDSAFTSTLWSTGYYTPSQTAGATYVANMYTWVVYGPLDSRNYRDFQAAFDVWPDFNLASNTKVGWAASIDGKNFCGNVELLSIPRWLRRTFVLPKSCAGQTGTPVYLGFLFQSDSSTPVGLGAFLDNVEVTGLPLYKTYMPLVRKDPTPIASPTPTAQPYPLTQSYDFGSLGKWCSTSNDSWASGIASMGGSNAYYLTMKQPSYLWALSPRDSSADNFRITADFSFLRMNSSLSLYDYRGARFGLLFTVKGNPFDPNDPCTYNGGQAESGIGFYRFIVKIKDDGSGYATLLTRWENGVEPEQSGSFVNLPAGVTINRTGWNTMRIDRDGANIKAYINDTLVQDWNNSNSGTGGWFGLFTETAGNNPSGWLFESDWDNIKVYNLRP